MTPMIEKVIELGEINPAIADDVKMYGTGWDLTAGEWRQLAADLRAQEHWAEHGPRLLGAAMDMLASPTFASRQHLSSVVAAATPKETP